MHAVLSLDGVDVGCVRLWKLVQNTAGEVGLLRAQLGQLFYMLLQALPGPTLHLQ